MAIMHGVEDALSFVSKRRWGIDRKDLFLLLSKQQRIYLVAYRVDEQVCNGGWSQFFTNSNKTQADFAPAALSTIGAERSSNLAKSALAVLADAGGWQSPDTLHERLKQEGIRDKLNALDSEFFDVARRAEPVLSLLDLYAAKNATHFR